MPLPLAVTGSIWRKREGDLVASAFPAYQRPPRLFTSSSLPITGPRGLRDLRPRAPVLLPALSLAGIGRPLRAAPLSLCCCSHLALETAFALTGFAHHVLLVLAHQATS